MSNWVDISALEDIPQRGARVGGILTIGVEPARRFFVEGARNEMDLPVRGARENIDELDRPRAERRLRRPGSVELELDVRCSWMAGDDRAC